LLAIDLEWPAEVRITRLTPKEIKEITEKVSQLQLLRKMELIFLMLKKMDESAVCSFYASIYPSNAKYQRASATVRLNFRLNW
jgi:hypothetical protein